MIQVSFKRPLVRSMIAFLWSVFLVGILYIPVVFDSFKSQKSLTIFCFGDVFDVEYISKFEQETGIKIYITYYENNDELMVKMRAGGGKGYDLIFPSDYLVDTLIKENLIQKIDKTKLDFWSSLDERLLGHYFDPKNEYSIPYLWGPYGIGYDIDFFKDKHVPDSWRYIFDKNYLYGMVGMINNAREAVLIAAYYLFGTIDNLSSQQLQAVQDLLIEQKKWVDLYSDLRIDYLLITRSSNVVAGMGNDLYQGYRYDKNIGFVVPKEGSFMVIDSVVMPASSQKQELIYSFINFLYRADVILHHVKETALFTAVKGLPLGQLGESPAFRSLEKIESFDFFRNVISENQLNDIWMALKAY